MLDGFGGFQRERTMTERRKRRRKQSKIKGFVDFVVWLDDDALIEEILVRLPVKSVIRFQLVCKSWLSLISSDRFRRLHTLRGHKPPPSLMLASRYRWNPIVGDERVKLFYSNPITKRSEKCRVMMMIPFDINVGSNFKTLSCSNGLMLLQSQDCSDDCYVYNPITKQSKRLSLAHNDKFIRVMAIHLVFDPSKSPHYKIVCIRMENEPLRRHQIEVFDSESGTWRVCVEPFSTTTSVETMMNLAVCVQCKSFIYLIYNHINYFRKPRYVYYIDIVKNVSEFSAIPLPERAQASSYSHSIQESNGSLYYCALLEDQDSERMSLALWKLQVNGDDPRCSKWLLMYHHKDRYGSDYDLYTLIAETRTVLLICADRLIVAYNFRDKSYNYFHHMHSQTSSVNYIHKFGETLALL